MQVSTLGSYKIVTVAKLKILVYLVPQRKKGKLHFENRGKAIKVYVLYRKDNYKHMLELKIFCECHKSVKLILQRSWKTRILDYKVNMYMNKCVNLWENFSGAFKCYSSILLSHFR